MLVRGELGKYPLLPMTVHHWVPFASCNYALPSDNLLKFRIHWHFVSPHMYSSLSNEYPNFSADILHQSGLPHFIQEDLSSRCRQSWVSIINKDFDLLQRNKFRAYVLFKTSFDFVLRTKADTTCIMICLWQRFLGGECKMEAILCGAHCGTFPTMLQSHIPQCTIL